MCCMCRVPRNTVLVGMSYYTIGVYRQAICSSHWTRRALSTPRSVRLLVLDPGAHLSAYYPSPSLPPHRPRSLIPSLVQYPQNDAWRTGVIVQKASQAIPLDYFVHSPPSRSLPAGALVCFQSVGARAARHWAGNAQVCCRERG